MTEGEEKKDGISILSNRRKKRRLPKKENHWPVNKDHSSHMAMRQHWHRAKGMTGAEKWFYEKALVPTKKKWTRQARWGFRLFDFWNAAYGLAIEVDGPEHDRIKDVASDVKEWDRSRIVVFRANNFNHADVERFEVFLRSLDTWNARRTASGMKPVLGGGSP